MSKRRFIPRLFIAGLPLALLMIAAGAPAAAGPEATAMRDNATSRPIVGAIRWDAWHGECGGPGRAVEAALGPERWHYRLPFFAQVLGKDNVRIDGATPEIMDREIEYARQAGLDYWAFVTYAPDDAMSLGLKNYLASPRRGEINFCLITGVGFGRRENHRAQIERFVSLMREPTYQKVAGGRPLFYLFTEKEEQIAAAWGSLEGFGAVLGEMRTLARQAGIGDPYIVVMNPGPDLAKKIVDRAGCDAASAYAVQHNGAGAPYAELTAYAEKIWDIYRSKGTKVVPIVMAGWDRRPRVQHPVPWEAKWQKPMENFDKYYEQATPEALAAHLARALRWVEANPQAAPARAVIIYAWNENDEGGWLVPTLDEGPARIEAIGRVLKREP